MTQNEKAAAAKKRNHAIMIIILILLFILFIMPFILVIINVFKTKADIVSDPLALIGAHGFTMQNFPEAMAKMNFWNVFKNSLIITIISTVLTIFVSAMASFVIVRNGKWKFCSGLFALMVASMVIPFQVLMVPLVSVYGGIFGVLNHRLTLILMHTGFSVSMATFMFHGAIHTNIPLELEEAALIDGCSILERLPPAKLSADRQGALYHPNRNTGILRDLLNRYRPRNGCTAAGNAAYPHPVSLPAEVHRSRSYIRSCKGLITAGHELTANCTNEKIL